MIVKYIVKALEQRDTVFVTGLGLFEKYYQSAQIVDNNINPPYNGLKFDPGFDGNGFNFEMFVAQQEGKLISETSQTIEEWVRNLKNAIDNNKSVSFENFGTFAKDAKGVITFACDVISELNLEFEGLNPVSTGNIAAEVASETVETEDAPEQIPVVEPQEKVEQEEPEKIEVVQEEPQVEKAPEESQEEIIAEPEKVAPVAETAEETEIPESEDAQPADDSKEESTQDVVSEETSAELEDEASNEVPEEKHKGKHKGLIITIVIILILALLAAAAYYFRTQLVDLYHQYFDKEPVKVEEVVETVIPEEPVFEDSTLMVNDSINEGDVLNQGLENEGSTTFTSSNTVNENQLPENSDDLYIDYERGKFYVIVGSFRTEKEVRRHIIDKHLESYHPKAVRQSGQNLRVCIGIFSTEQAAEDFGRESGRNYWVLK